MTNTDESVRYNKSLAHLGKTHLEFSVGGGTVGQHVALGCPEMTESF